MYIEPNSEVYLLSGVALDPTQRNTIYFDDKSKQTKYFKSKVIESFLKVSYQRVNRGYFRCGINAESVYTCNYMMFRNTAFGDKWFYAFVTKIEYVNDMTTQIEFVIDPIQSYWFDIQILESFVEREHSTTDEIGEHILPESVECGEYIYNGNAQEVTQSNICCNCVVVADKGGFTYSNVYSGVAIKVFPNTTEGTNNLNSFLADYLKTPDNIVAIYTCPQDVFGEISESGQWITDLEPTSHIQNVDGVAINKDTTLNGYKPKNKKLLTYPFNFNEIRNNCGQTLIQRYEFCHEKQPRYKILSNFTLPVQQTLVMDWYKNDNIHDRADYTETLTLSSFPMCSWNVDTFKAWVAQNSIPIAINSVNSAIGTITSLAKGSENNGTFNSIQSILTQGYSASISANQVKGDFASNNSMYANLYMNFYAQRKSITYEYAESIDNYFNCFGYSCHKTKKPNLNVRPHWCYTKTVGCNLKGNAPSDDIKAIKDIFDNGVTFWKNGDEIGNYSLDNSV